MGLNSAEEIYTSRKHKTLRQTLMDLTDNMSQMAHDIRSPLSALSTVISTAHSLSQEQRLILNHALKRINSISDDLIPPSEMKDSPKCVYFLKTSLESLLKEKEKQLLADHITFQLNLSDNLDTTDGQQFTSLLPEQILHRIFSNLIQNAMEAFELEHKQPVISIEGRRLSNKKSYDQLIVTIKDNGKGIEEHLIPMLTQKGMTFGKRYGSGLGLHHAKVELEKIGGNLEIQSTKGKGTEVEIRIPLSKPLQ